MSDEEKNDKWWLEYVEVRVNVFLPTKLVGDQWPDGLLIGYKQLVDPDFHGKEFLPAIIQAELERMSNTVTDQVQKEVERGTER